MRAGWRHRVMAVATMTPAHPSSMARAASEAVPMPASRMTGTDAPLGDEGDVVRVADAEPAADGRAQGHDRRAAGLLEPAGQHGVVVGVGEDDETLVAQLLGGVEQLDGVGEQRVLVPDDLELDPVGRRTPRGPAWR